MKVPWCYGKAYSPTRDGGTFPSTRQARNRQFPKVFDDLHFRFLKVRERGKEALEQGWQSARNYAYGNGEILNWVLQGGNYGVMCPSGFCCFVDADSQEIQEDLENELPKTFRYSTGKEGHFQYAYFIQDEPVGCMPLRDGAYIKGRGGYVLGPGSVHPNGTVYGAREIRDVPIAVVRKEDLLRALKDFTIPVPVGSNTRRFKSVQTGTSRIDRDEIVRILSPYWNKADGRRNDMT
ncbi:MAG: bifunctional DNA primase/polymerase, partial [Thermoplasmata archaeon]